MERLDIAEYVSDLDWCRNQELPWDSFNSKTVAISGASGMIGASLIDLLMRKNAFDGLNCRILAIGRNEEKAKKRFPYFDDPLFSFEKLDVSVENSRPSVPADFVIHLASSTHPRAYSTDPIGTISANVVGLKNLLEYACDCDAEKFLFASSVEVYGENRGDVDKFDESYCGFIDCNTLRAGYTESKRLGEALCQAYLHQKKISIVLPRLARTYGVTLLEDDSKALSQFIRNGVQRSDVVLKSKGDQQFSYLNVIDAVNGILWCLLSGKNGEAYNIADDASDVTLRDLAELIAHEAGTNVVFDLPDEVELAGYSTATKAMMNSEKLRSLGWGVRYGISEGLPKTVSALRQLWA